MNTDSRNSRYSGIAQMLHWAAVALLIWQYALALRVWRLHVGELKFSVAQYTSLGRLYFAGADARAPFVASHQYAAPSAAGHEACGALVGNRQSSAGSSAARIVAQRLRACASATFPTLTFVLEKS